MLFSKFANHQFGHQASSKMGSQLCDDDNDDDDDDDDVAVVLEVLNNLKASKILCELPIHVCMFLLTSLSYNSKMICCNRLVYYIIWHFFTWWFARKRIVISGYNIVVRQSLPWLFVLARYFHSRPARHIVSTNESSSTRYRGLEARDVSRSTLSWCSSVIYHHTYTRLYQKDPFFAHPLLGVEVDGELWWFAR